MIKRFFIFFSLSLVILSCKKKDSISSHNISGQVYNLCTDSGLANITVYLKESGNQIAQAVSGANGSFTFNNVQIHSRSDYTYNFYIPSKSGIGGGTEVGFDGVDNDVLDKSKLSQSFMLPVVPHSKVFYLYFPSSISSSIYSDTFTLVIQQNIYKKNVPTGNYRLTQIIAPCSPPSPVNYFGGASNYWMGLWNVTLDKTINGVHVIKKDSFYVGYGETKTDTIPW